jgi:hypothetical protein
LIGRPFSQKTRDHFLPLLTSTQWWSQTQLALRRIFQVDPDFQERMFARQMAVMKGQAWNVVETLKTPDHGPLELTRRAKVCVWDDLVDVPVAVPMRVTSAEMRRRTESAFVKTGAIEEEMDIGAANSSASAPVPDLLVLASPPAELPHPGRFELADSSSAGGAGDETTAAQSPDSSMQNSLVLNGSPGSNGGRPTRQALPRSSLSYGAPPRSLNMYSPERTREHQRRFSFATATARRNSNSIAQHLYGGGGARRHSHDVGDDDELEGDLGYAAAEGMEGNQRKVIVERLEPVKSRNPVFTWC